MLKLFLQEIANEINSNFTQWDMDHGPLRGSPISSRGLAAITEDVDLEKVYGVFKSKHSPSEEQLLTELKKEISLPSTSASAKEVIHNTLENKREAIIDLVLTKCDIVFDF